MEIALYILFCIVCLVACLYSDWEKGDDITVTYFLAAVVCSVIPALNLIILIIAISTMVDRHSYELKKFNFVLIKGKKQPWER